MTGDRPILVVDDDNRFRERLVRALEARGCLVLAAGSIPAARALCASSELAGAILDLRLGDSSGLELLPELLARDPSMPVVLLTGFGSIATALEAVRLGARDYLTKPVEPDQVIAVLRGQRPTRETSKEVPGEVPTLDRVEWEHIQRVLAGCGGNISQAARMLGIDRRSLQRKLAKYPPPR